MPASTNLGAPPKPPTRSSRRKPRSRRGRRSGKEASESKGSEGFSGSDGKSEVGAGLELARKETVKGPGKGKRKAGGPRLSSLTTAPAPPSAAPTHALAATPTTPPQRTLTSAPQTPQAPRSPPTPAQSATAVAPKPHPHPQKPDIVLAPPSSAFTFTCVRSPSPPTLPRSAGSLNLAALSTAETPAPTAKRAPRTAKAPPALFAQAELGSSPGKAIARRVRKPAPDPPSEEPAPPPPTAKPALALNTGIATLPATPLIATPPRTSARLTGTHIPVPILGSIPLPPPHNAPLCEDPAPRAPGPATRDGLSRFFPPRLGRKAGTVAPPGSLAAAGNSDVPIPASPLRSPPVDYLPPQLAAQGCYSPRGRDMDEGYESRSETEGWLASPLARVGFGHVGSPSLSVSPSGSGEGWVGGEEGFWV